MTVTFPVCVVEQGNTFRKHDMNVLIVLEIKIALFLYQIWCNVCYTTFTCILVQWNFIYISWFNVRSYNVIISVRFNAIHQAISHCQYLLIFIFINVSKLLHKGMLSFKNEICNIKCFVFILPEYN